MKQPDSFLTNTEITTGRGFGAAKNNPGDNTGTGADKETYNDTVYSSLAVINSYREQGVSDSDETTANSDMRDAIEEMVAKKVDSIADWDNTTIYSTANTLVMSNGFQFLNFNTTGNQAKEPLLNPDFWFKSPSPDNLMDMFYDGMPILGGLSNIHDRNNASYRQNCLIGRYRLGTKGSDYYNFYMVHLDGTTVTGDATLEAIFNGYWNIDMVAPDSLGTRTLIDCGEYIPTPQSNGGNNDTVGVLLEDRFQGHGHLYNTSPSNTLANSANPANSYNSSLDGSGDGLWWTGSPSQRSGKVGVPISDGTNGTPRTGATTRPKELTVGISYIIVMTTATI